LKLSSRHFTCLLKEIAMASALPLVVVTRSAAEPPLPASATAAAIAGHTLPHSSVSELHKMLRVGWGGLQPPVPMPRAVLTARRPWIRDKADLIVFNAWITAGVTPRFLFRQGGNEKGSVTVRALKTSAGKMFVFEFVGHSTHGADLRVFNGPTVHRFTGAFKLPIAITSDNETATVRIYVENWEPSFSDGMLDIFSIKVWAVT